MRKCKTKTYAEMLETIKKHLEEHPPLGSGKNLCLAFSDAQDLLGIPLRQLRYMRDRCKTHPCGIDPFVYWPGRAERVRLDLVVFVKYLEGKINGRV